MKRIRWLPQLRSLVRDHVAAEGLAPQSGATKKVYAILLCEPGVNHYAAGNPVEPWGIYIGQTAKRIEDRLAQHLDAENTHGARGLPRRGYQLLHSVSSVIPCLLRAEALRFEGVLLDRLKGTASNATPLRGLSAQRVSQR